MSRKHYIEVEFASEVTLTNVFKFSFVHAGRNGDPTRYGNHLGIPITCYRGYALTDNDDTNQRIYDMEFAVNGSLHEVVTTYFVNTPTASRAMWSFNNPLTLQNDDYVFLRTRFSTGTGSETQVVMIFEWEGDVP